MIISAEPEPTAEKAQSERALDQRQMRVTDLLAEMAARGSTLDERLSKLDRVEATRESPDTATANATMTAWITNVARGDRELFAQRLAWDGLRWQDAVRALQVPPPARDELPAWVLFLAAAFNWTTSGEWPTAETPRAIDTERPLPFEELLVPLVVHAQGEVARRAAGFVNQLAAEAHVALERALLAQLTRICTQPLYVAFAVSCAKRGHQIGKATPQDTPVTRAHYAHFLSEMKSDKLLGFFREYSVAARLCATTTLNWIIFAVEYLERLAADRAALERRFGNGENFGPVISLEVGISDAHDGGRGVIISRFENGARVVYKPRSVALEVFFADVVQWCNDAGLSPKLRPVQALARAGYGWLEWIGPSPCTDEEDLARFYRRCGMLLAIVHGVHGTDFHSGNLLAIGAHPVLIDAETLLTHKFELEGEGEQDENDVAARVYLGRTGDAVTRTLLLPYLKFTIGGQAVDLGGLTLAEPQEGFVDTVSWCDVNTDAMRLGPVKAPVGETRNLPVLDGRLVTAADYLDEVRAGFQEAYTLLLARRDELLSPEGLLARLGAQTVRFIIRHTSLYVTLLERALHPKFLRDGAARTVELDVLARPLLQQARQRPPMWPLLAQERRELEQMDVPLFATRADARSVELPNGERVDCFAASACAEARRKLLGLSQEDLQRQDEMIQASFAAVMARGLVTSPIRPDAEGTAGAFQSATTGPGNGAVPSRRSPGERLEDRALDEANRLGDVLIARAHFERDVPAWAGSAYNASARRHTPSCGHPTLLDGSAGVGLALAAIATVTGRRDLAEHARASFEPLRGSLRGIDSRLERGTLDPGLGTGLASCAYGLLRAGELLGDLGLRQSALAWAAHLDPAKLPAKGSNDLLTGRAGALLFLLRLHAATGDPEWRGRALTVADQLLARQTPDRDSGLASFVTRHGRAESGLAHGQSGVALSLVEAAAASGRADLRTVALEIMAFERLIRDRDQEAAVGYDACGAWSHGAGGVGLARVVALSLGEDTELRRDLEAAVERVRQSLLAGSDTLGSGVFGRIELLQAAAEPLARPELRAEAHIAALATLDRANSAGHYRLGWHANFEHPGFFQGLAGIAYGWARLAKPQKVPSAAVWA